MRNYAKIFVLVILLSLFNNPAFAKSTLLAPDFKLINLKKDTVVLSSYRKLQQPVLLIFWTTWCPYCRDQLMEINDKYAKLIKNNPEKRAKMPSLSIEPFETRFASFDKYINLYRMSYFLPIPHRRGHYKEYGFFQQTYAILYMSSTSLLSSLSSLLVRLMKWRLADDKRGNSPFFQNNLKLLAINVGEPIGKVERFVSLRNFSYEFLLDQDTNVARSFDIRGVPTYILIDKDGYILTADNSFPEEEIDGLLNMGK